MGAQVLPQAADAVMAGRAGAPFPNALGCNRRLWGGVLWTGRYFVTTWFGPMGFPDRTRLVQVDRLAAQANETRVHLALES